MKFDEISFRLIRPTPHLLQVFSNEYANLLTNIFNITKIHGTAILRKTFMYMFLK